MKIWKKNELLRKVTCNIRKDEGEKIKKKRSSLNFGWKIRKVEPSWESSSGILGKLGKFSWVRKIFLRLGKFIRKIGKEILRLGKLSDNIRKVEGET